MSTLKIKKLQSGAFEHIDSIDRTFFLGRFNFKHEFNKAFLVEAYGAKRRTYGISDIEVYNYLGSAETFTNWTDLINRLVDLSYTGIDTNSIPSGGGVWGGISGTLSNQTDLQNALNSKQDVLTSTSFGTFSNSLTTDDTIPDAGIFNYTNVLGIQVKTTWANIKAKLASIFLTKVSTVDVEKVYIKNADGTQGMKPTSEFKDVLEFADFDAFPTTGETGIIYVALDKNFTYRWSGSAYVKIGGINQDLYPIKHWYQATGTGMGTYGTNVMGFQGTQSDVYVNTNLLSYRKIASAATAGTTISARESSFGRVMPNKGFQFLLRFRIADAATISDVRGFHGLQIVHGFLNTDISANTNQMCGIGCDGTDTNIHIFSRQSLFGTLVKIDTGFSKTLNHEYLLTQERLPNSNDVVFTLKNLTSSTEFTSTVVNNSSYLTIVNHRNNNASNLSCGFEIQRQELNLSE